jgi:hypothetical protein
MTVSLLANPKSTLGLVPKGECLQPVRNISTPGQGVAVPYTSIIVASFGPYNRPVIAADQPDVLAKARARRSRPT